MIDASNVGYLLQELLNFNKHAFSFALFLVIPFSYFFPFQRWFSLIHTENHHHHKRENVIMHTNNNNISRITTDYKDKKCKINYTVTVLKNTDTIVVTNNDRIKNIKNSDKGHTTVKCKCDINQIKVPNLLTEFGSLHQRHSKPTDVTLSPWRWFVLASYCLLSLVCGSSWLCFPAVSNILRGYYGINIVAVNLLSIVFGIALVIFSLPFAMLLEKYGLSITLKLSSFMNVIGATIKFFGDDRQSGYWFLLCGNVFTAVSVAGFLFLPGKIAILWFGAKEIGKATSICVAFDALGAGIGFLHATSMIPNDIDPKIVHTGVQNFLMSHLVSGILVFIFVFIFAKDRPKLLPNSSAAEHKQQLSQLNRQQEKKVDGIHEFTESNFSKKSLCKNCSEYAVQVHLNNDVKQRSSHSHSPSNAATNNISNNNISRIKSQIFQKKTNSNITNNMITSHDHIEDEHSGNILLSNVPTNHEIPSKTMPSRAIQSKTNRDVSTNFFQNRYRSSNSSFLSSKLHPICQSQMNEISILSFHGTDLRLSIWSLLKNKDFQLIFNMQGIVASLEGIYEILLNEMLIELFPGKERSIGILGFVAVVFGFITNILVGAILDETGKYKLVSFVIFTLTTILSIAWCITIQFSRHFIAKSVVFCLLMSVSTSYYTIAFAHSAEVTRPISPSAVGVMLVLTSQIYDTVTTFLATKILLEFGALTVNLCAVAVCIVGTIMTYFVSGQKSEDVNVFI